MRGLGQLADAEAHVDELRVRAPADHDAVTGQSEDTQGLQSAADLPVIDCEVCEIKKRAYKGITYTGSCDGPSESDPSGRRKKHSERTLETERPYRKGLPKPPSPCWSGVRFLCAGTRSRRAPR